MKDAMNDHELRFYLVDKAIGPDDQFAQPREGRIGKRSTAIAELREAVAGVAYALSKRGGKGLGVDGDELYCGHQIVSRGLRPDYFAAHFARRCFTWS